MRQAEVDQLLVSKLLQLIHLMPEFDLPEQWIQQKIDLMNAEPLFGREEDPVRFYMEAVDRLIEILVRRRRANMPPIAGYDLCLERLKKCLILLKKRTG